MSEEITGRDIIEELLQHMESNSQPLFYSILVPSVYQVCLHPQDYKTLETIFSVIRDQARKALSERLQRLNKPTLIGRLKSGNATKYENVQGDWFVDFQPDTDGEITSQGQFIVYSQLLEPSKPGYGTGDKTIRLKTIRTAVGSKSVEKKEERVYAQFTYTDESGDQIYLMTKKEIVIGRGGPSHWVDIEVKTVDDVSRNHVRVRYDENSNKFYIKDLSLLGTSVNGIVIPRSIKEIDGINKEIDTEHPLPAISTIVLAGKQSLNFKAGGGR
jgi:hypothetical protein